MLEKKHALIALALALPFGLAACQPDTGDDGPRPLTAQEAEIVAASNDFGLSLFGEILGQSDGGNVFVSPLSVSMALGMTFNGAAGATAEGMREALRFGDLSVEDIDSAYLGLIGLLTTMDGKVTLEIANSIWYRQGFDVLAAFIEACETYFLAVVEALDFGDPGAKDAINAWVAEQTHGLIDAIVDDIGADTVMFLINAVYFKGDWTFQFDESLTADAEFHVDAETTSHVAMMQLHGDVPHRWGEGFRAVDLPYGDGHFAMAVILPDEGVPVDDVAAGLTTEGWAALAAGFADEETTVELPRFTLEYEQALNDVLCVLGMDEAFDPLGADFTGITPEGGIFISEVKHKTFVRVDEVGTEAAAVTSVEMEMGSAPEPFRVDRPFLVVLHDRHSGAILFIGKIVDPPPA
jgi:serpin B